MRIKTLTMSLMTVAALASTGCTKENPAGNNEKTETTFSFRATEPQTKTSIDGYVTSWTADDEMAVFHTQTGSSEFGSNDRFTITSGNLSAKWFTGTLTEELMDGTNYDWYAIYPHKSITTPAGSPSDTEYCIIGDPARLTQNGNDSKTHLAGTNCPLYGKATDVPSSDPLSITMNHLTSCVRIKVNNTAELPLYVTTVSFASDEYISGAFDVDITGETPVYSPRTTSQVKSEALLYVKGAEAIPVGGTASYYIPVKPHSIKTGKVTVNGLEKPISLDSEVAFTAGSIKPLTFNYGNNEDYSGVYLMTDVSATSAALAWSSSDNNLKPFTLTLNADSKILGTDGIEKCKMTFTRITEGEYAGLYTIEDANSTAEVRSYLYAAGAADKNNHLKSISTLDANCYWSVSKASGGGWSIAAVKSGAMATRIRYNGTSKFFTCYSDGYQYQNVLLYPWADVVEQASAEYTWNFYNGNADNKPGWNKAYTAGSMTWTPSKTDYDSVNTANILVGSENLGVQFGNAQKYVKELMLTGKGFSSEVKKVVVNTSYKNAAGGSLVSVTVGGTAMTAPAELALTSSAKDYVFTSETGLTGDIVITWTNVVKTVVDGVETETVTASGINVKTISIN